MLKLSLPVMLTNRAARTSRMGRSHIQNRKRVATAEGDYAYIRQIHHPLHLPTFLSQYNRFWQLDTASRCRTVHSRWLALLYIILCLGVYFGEEEARDEGLLAVGDTPCSIVTQLPGCQLLTSQACQDCLSHSDFLNQSSLEGIQTIICLNLYLNNNDQSSAAKSFLGLAIKMAIMLGLSVSTRS